MTEKQFFGAIVRGIGLWLICQWFPHILTAVGALFEVPHGNGGAVEWLLRELLQVALGIFLIVRAPWVVERCYAPKE